MYYAEPGMLPGLIREMTRMKMTPEHVRTALLNAQGLIETPTSATKEDVYAAIRRMHVLQIDTISVVNRSPYLVLHARIGDYPQQWLTDLLAERQIFEYWSHAACFLPMEDYKYYRPFMLAKRADDSRASYWRDQKVTPEVMDNVRRRITQEGALRSADFERQDGDKSGWWNWKAEKHALEYLFDIGELMVSKRDKFQRIYDLQERVQPWDDVRHTPTPDDSFRAWVEQTVLALGVAPAEWIPDYFRLAKAEARPALQSLIDDGTLIKIDVAGESAPYYAHKSAKKTLKAITDGVITPRRTILLSPFDPIAWHRERLLAMFGMDYKIEVYTPQPKRKYGYFTLPILHEGRMIGRLDPKAHRAEKRFEVKAIYLEPNVTPDEGMVHGLAAAIRDFAAWHGTPEVTIGATNPPSLGDALRATGLLG